MEASAILFAIFAPSRDKENRDSRFRGNDEGNEMFGWFKRKSRQAKITRGKLYPECLWTVELSENGISATDQNGTTSSVPLDGMRTVAIATNDSGPWRADVWWLIYGRDGQLSCGFPQGAAGEKEVLDYLFALPNFNNEEVIKAMGSTSDAVFLAWQKSEMSG